MKYGWLKDAERFLLLLLIVFGVFQFLIGFSFIKGESMEPTLRDGELVLYVRTVRQYETGDVVSVLNSIRRILCKTSDRDWR